MAEVLSQFSGVAGQVLRRVPSSTWVSGVALAGTLLLAARGLYSIGRPDIFPLAAIPCLMLGLAYHGVSAAAPRPSGLSATVGRTIGVAARAALASAVWLVPWVLWGASLGQTPARFESIGAPSPVAAGLYLLGCLIATPVILIAALHSRGWPIYWGRRFRARSNDLMTVYTIQTGALVLSIAVVLPLVFGALEVNPTAGLVAAAFGTCAIVGYWISLTGRLCGAISAAPVDDSAVISPPRFDEGMTFAGPALDTGLNRDMAEQPIAEEPVAVTIGASREESDEPVATKKQTGGDVLEATKVRRDVVRDKPVVSSTPRPAKNGRKTPLLDAEARTEEAMKRFRLDPSHTLSKLADMNLSFAPNAHVLQALAICLHRTGHVQQALAAARRAFPLCFERGYVAMAATMFYELRGYPQRLDLKKDEVLGIAKELQQRDELATAAKAYSLVIHSDPNEILAAKGLLDVADGIHNDKKNPVAALKVYKFLLEHSKDPGVVQGAHDGVQRCENPETD